MHIVHAFGDFQILKVFPQLDLIPIVPLILSFVNFFIGTTLTNLEKILSVFWIILLQLFRNGIFHLEHTAGNRKLHVFCHNLCKTPGIFLARRQLFFFLNQDSKWDFHSFYGHRSFGTAALFAGNSSKSANGSDGWIGHRKCNVFSTQSI